MGSEKHTERRVTHNTASAPLTTGLVFSDSDEDQSHTDEATVSLPVVQETASIRRPSTVVTTAQSKAPLSTGLVFSDSDSESHGNSSDSDNGLSDLEDHLFAPSVGTQSPAKKSRQTSENGTPSEVEKIMNPLNSSSVSLQNVEKLSSSSDSDLDLLEKELGFEIQNEKPTSPLGMDIASACSLKSNEIPSQLHSGSSLIDANRNSDSTDSEPLETEKRQEKQVREKKTQIQSARRIPTNVASEKDEAVARSDSDSGLEALEQQLTMGVATQNPVGTLQSKARSTRTLTRRDKQSPVVVRRSARMRTAPVTPVITIDDSDSDLDALERELGRGVAPAANTATSINDCLQGNKSKKKIIVKRKTPAAKKPKKVKVSIRKTSAQKPRKKTSTVAVDSDDALQALEDELALPRPAVKRKSTDNRKKSIKSIFQQKRKRTSLKSHPPTSRKTLRPSTIQQVVEEESSGDEALLALERELRSN